VSAVWKWRRAPAQVVLPVPDQPPVSDELAAMRASALFDMHDRRTRALILIEAGLTAELSRTAMRDLLLDVRSVLLPSEPLPLRPAVPIIPGRTS
jgi:hypothetical protein